MRCIANKLIIRDSSASYIINLTITYGVPTENIVRKMRYIIGEVWKLSDILRVNGKISQQTINPTAIKIKSMIITNRAFVHK